MGSRVVVLRGGWEGGAFERVEARAVFGGIRAGGVCERDAAAGRLGVVWGVEEEVGRSKKGRSKGNLKKALMLLTFQTDSFSRSHSVSLSKRGQW